MPNKNIVKQYTARIISYIDTGNNTGPIQEKLMELAIKEGLSPVKITDFDFDVKATEEEMSELILSYRKFIKKYPNGNMFVIVIYDERDQREYIRDTDEI